MVLKYFMAANTKDGFYSPGNIFPPGAGDYLHIIKAGPGGGKSGFMRAIGEKAEALGMDVHYVLCSGDPDSLDGVYIPELKEAWIDGTNPHTREPAAYGADSDYVALSGFCDLNLSHSDKNYVNLYSKSAKKKYEEAYALLMSLFSLRKSMYLSIADEYETDFIYRKISNILRKCKSGPDVDFHLPHKLFLSAVSCRGHYRLEGEISKLCKLSFRICSRYGADTAALDIALHAAEDNGEKIICVLSPLCPEKLTALILPQRQIALLDSGWNVETAHNINLDTRLSKALSREKKQEFKFSEKLAAGIEALAFKRLSEAKAFHDSLEAVYRPYMNFQALNEFTDKYINKIFI